MDVARVTHGSDEGGASLRIEANRPYVVVVALAMIGVVIIAFVILEVSGEPLAVALAVLVLLLGARLLYIVGPARVLTHPWISAASAGISAHTSNGTTRYAWDRVVSIRWQLAGLAPGRYTIVEVNLSLGAPDEPYGPIRPLEVYLWFLGSRKRSLELGREFLSICRRYGVNTNLMVGSVRED